MRERNVARLVVVDDTIVREIMVPRPDMVSVSATATRDEVIAVILEAGHSRLPVYGADRDEIEGILAEVGVRITRLARGLPMGGDLEYIDSVTLAHALLARHEVS